MIHLDNYRAIQASLKAYRAQLVAVSKTKPVEAIQQFYDLGHRVFGENRVQELSSKYASLPKDIRWHMIGSLQRNKVKVIAPFIDLIHSVDSFRLLKEINKQAKNNDRIIRCLLQFHIAEEQTKAGLVPTEAEEMLKSDDFSLLQNIAVVGIMGMATFTDNRWQIQQEFAKLKSIFDQLKQGYFSEDSQFKEISMGMSGDYEIALKEGSSLIRVGSKLFGTR